MKILFFAPNSAVPFFAHAEAVLANSLMHSGNEVTFISCGKLYSTFCTSMMAYNISYESDSLTKLRLCNICSGNIAVMRRFFSLPGEDLANHVTSEDREQTSEILASTDQANYLSVSIDQQNLGRIALYDFLLMHKKNRLIFSENEWDIYLTFLKNTILTYVAAKRLLSAICPDRVIIYNPLYASNGAFRAAADFLNIPVYHIHASENLSLRSSHLFITKNNTYNLRKQLKKQWSAFRDIPAKSPALNDVASHFEELFSARSVHVYSAARGSNVMEKLQQYGLREGQKLVLATLSSYDERFAGEECGALAKVENSVFNSQIEWIRSLIIYFSQNQDLFLLIRVHPREFPNRREKVTSEHAVELAAEFAKLPQNVCINWPEDRLSLYDLAEHTDLVLNAWSSAGEEMAIFGIPVLIYSPDLVMYAPSINFLETEYSAYTNAIRKLAYSQPEADYVRKAFRWYSLKMNLTSFQILQIRRGGIFRIASGWLRMFLFRFRNRLTHRYVVDLLFYKSMLKFKKNVNVSLINKFLEGQMETLVDFAEKQYGGADKNAETTFLIKFYSAWLSRCASSDSPAKYAARLSEIIRQLGAKPD